jgi:hypothetical protein
MNEKKLSEVMIEMAKQLLKTPQEIPSSEPFHVALLLAAVAWNREVVGDDFQSKAQYYDLISEIEKHDPVLWDDLVSSNCEAMISKLREYKRNKYLFDRREIVFCGTNERGNIEVNWV